MAVRVIDKVYLVGKDRDKRDRIEARVWESSEKKTCQQCQNPFPLQHRALKKMITPSGVIVEKGHDQYTASFEWFLQDDNGASGAVFCDTCTGEVIEQSEPSFTVEELRDTHQDRSNAQIFQSQMQGAGTDPKLLRLMRRNWARH